MLAHRSRLLPTLRPALRLDLHRRGPDGGQGFQGYGFHLSTDHFEILREVYGLIRFVCFCFPELGPLDSIFETVSLESPSTNTNCETMACRSFKSEKCSARGVRKFATGICVYMCIYIYIYIHTHIYTYTYTHIHYSDCVCCCLCLCFAPPVLLFVVSGSSV